MLRLFLQLAVVHLVDAHHCTDSSKFVSVVMLSLSSMVRLELPHINVLSKIDLIQQYGKLGTFLCPLEVSAVIVSLTDSELCFSSVQLGLLHGRAGPAVPARSPGRARRCR